MVPWGAATAVACETTPCSYRTALYRSLVVHRIVGSRSALNTFRNLYRMPHVIYIPMLSSTFRRYIMASRTLFMVGGKTGAVGRGTLGSFGGAGSATGLGAISNYEYYGKLNRFGNIR